MSPFQDGTPTSKTFEHVTSEIGAEEAEEVGVEHLLRYAYPLHAVNTAAHAVNTDAHTAALCHTVHALVFFYCSLKARHAVQQVPAETY